MSTTTSKKKTKAAAGRIKKNPRCYTEGVIKDLWLESVNDARFTMTPDPEYSIAANHKGETKICSVFRQEGFEERLCDKCVVALYAGDFIFSTSTGMTFDQLLQIKVHACHLRIYVKDKDALVDCDTIVKDKMNQKFPVPTSEIRLKQK